MKDEIKEEYIKDMCALHNLLAKAYTFDKELFNKVNPRIVFTLGDKPAIEVSGSRQVVHHNGGFDLWLGTMAMVKADADELEIMGWILQDSIGAYKNETK